MVSATAIIAKRRQAVTGIRAVYGEVAVQATDMIVTIAEATMPPRCGHGWQWAPRTVQPQAELLAASFVCKLGMIS
jgi:hypothetical protein